MRATAASIPVLEIHRRCGLADRSRAAFRDPPSTDRPPIAFAASEVRIRLAQAVSSSPEAGWQTKIFLRLGVSPGPGRIQWPRDRDGGDTGVVGIGAIHIVLTSGTVLRHRDADGVRTGCDRLRPEIGSALAGIDARSIESDLRGLRVLRLRPRRFQRCGARTLNRVFGIERKGVVERAFRRECPAGRPSMCAVCDRSPGTRQVSVVGLVSGIPTARRLIFVAARDVAFNQRGRNRRVRRRCCRSPRSNRRRAAAWRHRRSRPADRARHWHTRRDSDGAAPPLPGLGCCAAL